jgi:hypothetical protein
MLASEEAPKGDLEAQNAVINGELERVFGSTPFADDEKGTSRREVEGASGLMNGNLVEAAFSKLAPQHRIISLTLSGELGQDQYGGVSYIYGTRKGDLSRQTTDSPIDVFKDVNPAEHPTLESYRKALYEQIGRNTTRVVEGAKLEQEMGLHKGAEAEYMEDFLTKLKEFIPEGSNEAV